MKKHNLFKVIGITILVAVILTWILPITYYSYGIVSDGTRSQIGLSDLFSYPSVALQYFGNNIIFLLVIGGFYGILYKTGAYRKLLDKLVSKFKGKEKIVIAFIISLLAILTSVCGVSIGIWIIIPFIISLILMLGYDKITAAMVSVGSIVVGLMGTTFASTYVMDSYSVKAQNGMGIINSILNTNAMAQLLPKIIILVLGIALLIFNTIRHISKTKTDKTTENNNEYIPELVNTDSKIWPLVVIIDLVFIVMLLSFTSWSSVFGLNIFSKATEAVLSSFKIAKFPILGKILGNIPAFEEWSILNVSTMLVIASFIISKIYKIKFNEYLDSFVDGAKKAIKPALLVTFIYVVLIAITYNPIVLTITKPLLTLTKGLNSFTMSLVSFITSVFYVDIYYVASSTLQYITEIITDSSVYSVIALIWQGMYGFMSLFAPTSIILIAILSYLNVSYGKWIKSIWKFILEILAVLLIVFTILVILI
ncbi:MAG: hypothetical protein PUD59_01040 [bacterium]|nr:hypothetical protein [bacterium]